MRGILIVGGGLLILAVALWLLWLGPAFRKGREQQAAVRKLKGFVKLESNWTGHVIAVWLKESNDDAVKQLIELNPAAMFELHIVKSELSDETLKRIQTVKQLRELDLSETPVTATGVDTLVEMTQLQRLNLSGAGVVHEDVKRIEKATPGISVQY